MTKGYQNYRGRRDRGHKLLMAVLALILAASCVYLLAQRYITYTDDGGMRLDLPFFSQRAETDGDQPAAPTGGETEDRPQETAAVLERSRTAELGPAGNNC